MKNLRIILSTLLVLASTVVGAQNLKKKGKLDATTTKVFNFERNGTQIPYKVTIQESRIYNIKFDENDKGK